MDNRITTVAELESVIGKTPPPMQNKVINFLDAGTLRWVAATPIVFLTFSRAGNVGITLAGGAPGFVRASEQDLVLPRESLDEPELAVPGASFGSLWLLPQIREAIRINGVVARADDQEIEVRVQECYGHCAKALIRSDFWNAQPHADGPWSRSEVAAACSFMLLASADGEGRADLSPKGDPPGELVRFLGETLWFADRPGNKRVDSFRNILSQPAVAALLIAPGSSRVGVWQGEAAMTTDPVQRAHFVVQGRTPALVTSIAGGPLTIRDSRAIQRAALWPAPPAPEGIDSLEILMGHSKHNQGAVAKALTGGLMAVAKDVVKKGLEDHYKKTLY